MHGFGRQLGGHTRFLIGRCDGGATPRALGPLIDIAAEIGVDADLESVGVDRVSLYWRVRTALGRAPTVWLLEDLHWADEATLDLVRHIARRMDGLAVLVVATFRDDEVTANHPLAVLMGELATAATVTRMQLPLLTMAAVAELVEISGRDIDVAVLHGSTDGSRFCHRGTRRGHRAAARHGPRSVAAGTAGLSVGARTVADTTAVIGPIAEIGLVLATSGNVENAGRMCCQRGAPRPQGTAVTFRHELARQAVLDAYRQRGGSICTGRYSPSSRSREAGTTAASRTTPSPAETRPPSSSMPLVRRSSRHAWGCTRRPPNISGRRCGTEIYCPADRADLLERLSFECGITSQTVEAFDTRREPPPSAGPSTTHARSGWTNAGFPGCRGSSAATTTRNGMPEPPSPRSNRSPPARISLWLTATCPS